MLFGTRLLEFLSPLVTTLPEPILLPCNKYTTSPQGLLTGRALMRGWHPLPRETVNA